MPGSAFLIAPDGRWLDERSPEFLVGVLGDPAPDYDAALFAVRNLGCIRVRRHGPLLATAVHPRTVARRAIDAVVPVLGMSDAEVFRISHLRCDWQHETAVLARAATVRMFELCALAQAAEG